MHKWKTRQVDFVLAFPQADIEFDIYMNIPKGIQTKYGDGNTRVLKLQENLYGQRQAGRVWVDHLKENLIKIGFKPSLVDECVFYRGRTIFMFYVDGGIFMAPTDREIDKAIKDLQKQKYDIEDKGDIQDYLVINIEYVPGNKMKLSQPHLISQIIKQADLNPRVAPKETPGASTKILHYGVNLPDFYERYHYRSIIGKLNFLEKETRPDLAYYAHHCARFSENPKVIHDKAVDLIIKYLMITKDDGLIFKPTRSKCIEVYADVDFCGNRVKETAEDDVSTAKSRSGYVIAYAGCSIIWASKLQTQVALSTTEAEFIVLSQALREAIHVMQLLEDLKQRKISSYDNNPIIKCKAFEDKSGALELARTPKIRPRTKHLNVVYHHFREHVRKGLIQVLPISIDDQIADLFTKSLPQKSILKHRKSLLHF